MYTYVCAIQEESSAMINFKQTFCEIHPKCKFSLPSFFFTTTIFFMVTSSLNEDQVCEAYKDDPNVYLIHLPESHMKLAHQCELIFLIAETISEKISNPW